MKIEVPKNAEWKAMRLARWEGVWQRAGRIVNCSKAERKVEDAMIAARKEWYLHGDLTPTMNLSDKYNYLRGELYLRPVMQLCPVIELEAYLQLFQEHSVWLSQKQWDCWSPNVNDRDVRFFESFFALYKKEHLDSNKEIFQYMLNVMLPDETGLFKFPLALGNDHWQPTQQVALCDCADDLLHSFRAYLFEEDYQGFSHVAKALPIIRFIKDLDPQYFDTTLLTEKPGPLAPPPTPRRISGAGQRLLRAVFGNLLGYKSHYDHYEGPLRHNDPEVEEQLRTLINSLDMPKDYHRLVEFIHAHPNDYVRRSEER